MSEYIRRIKVVSLFSKENLIDLDFSDGANCIFGVNGAGKTTIINLIDAIITCKINYILKLPFSSVEIFTAKRGQKRSRRFIKIEKDGKRGFYYAFPNLQVDDYYFPKVDKRDSFLNENIENIVRLIKKHLDLIHVPLTRVKITNEPNMGSFYVHIDGRDVGGLYDQRHGKADSSKEMLHLLNREFEKKWSLSQRRINHESSRFSRKITKNFLLDKQFLSKADSSWDKWLNYNKSDFVKPDSEELIQKFKSANIDIAMTELEQHLEIWETISRDLLNSQEEYLRRKKEGDDDLGDYGEKFFRVFMLRPIMDAFFKVVNDVESLQNRKNEMIKWVRDFEDVINGFLVNKELKVSTTGSFRITSGKKELNIDDLSSGEKHIIALLGRVCLSGRKGSILIADEPELSLHLEWQRKIIYAIKKLAPDMQLIFATHSPAIITNESNMVRLGG